MVDGEGYGLGLVKGSCCLRQMVMVSVCFILGKGYIGQWFWIR